MMEDRVEVAGYVVALISARYVPNTGPAVNRVRTLAQGLTKHGWKPVVLASEHDPRRWVAEWKVVDDPLRREDQTAGRIGSGNRRRQGKRNKALNTIVPMEPHLTLSLRSMRRAFASVWERERPHVVFATGGPMATLVGAGLIKKRYGLPLILDLRDPWTQNPVRIWPSYIHYLIEAILERWVLKQADQIIMNTPTARRDLLRKYPWLDEQQVHVVSHGFDGAVWGASVAMTPPGEVASRERIRLAYAGGFYLTGERGGSTGNVVAASLKKAKRLLRYAKAVDTGSLARGSSPHGILRAIAMYNRERRAGMPEVVIDFIGGSPIELRGAIAAYGLQHVARILPRVPAWQLREDLSSYDAFYLVNPTPIPDSPFVASKTFEYLAACKPILAELAPGDNAELVRRANSGWVCGPGDVEALVKLLNKLAGQRMEHRPAIQPDVAFVNLFEREYQVTDFMSVVRCAVERNGDGPIISQGYRRLRVPSETRKSSKDVRGGVTEVGND